MPEMNGRDLASTMLMLRPGMKRLFMSGYTADVIAPHGVLDDGEHFIQKPFSFDQLTSTIRAALGSYSEGTGDRPLFAGWQTVLESEK
jgi:FixJ family two-component response regulator